jgi:hypothetical protein
VCACGYMRTQSHTHTRTHTRTQLSNPSGLLWFYCLLQCVHCFKRSIAPARTKQQKPENRHTILMGRQLPCAANQITTRSNTWCRNLAPDIQLPIVNCVALSFANHRRPFISPQLPTRLAVVAFMRHCWLLGDYGNIMCVILLPFSKFLCTLGSGALLRCNIRT